MVSISWPSALPALFSSHCSPIHAILPNSRLLMDIPSVKTGQQLYIPLCHTANSHAPRRPNFGTLVTSHLTHPFGTLVTSHLTHPYLTPHTCWNLSYLTPHTWSHLTPHSSLLVYGVVLPAARCLILLTPARCLLLISGCCVRSVMSCGPT